MDEDEPDSQMRSKRVFCKSHTQTWIKQKIALGRTTRRIRAILVPYWTVFLCVWLIYATICVAIGVSPLWFIALD